MTLAQRFVGETTLNPTIILVPYLSRPLLEGPRAVASSEAGFHNKKQRLRLCPGDIQLSFRKTKGHFSIFFSK